MKQYLPGRQLQIARSCSLSFIRYKFIYYMRLICSDHVRTLYVVRASGRPSVESVTSRYYVRERSGTIGRLSCPRIQTLMHTSSQTTWRLFFFLVCWRFDGSSRYGKRLINGYGCMTLTLLEQRPNAQVSHIFVVYSRSG